MKSGLVLVLLLASQLSFAQSLKEKKIKQKMLDQVDTLVVLIDEARASLETEDVATACKKIGELFKLTPDHLVSIGTRMDLFDRAVIKMENESKMHLIYLHKQKNICETEIVGENLDIGETSRKLKAMKKALNKQKKKIKKSHTDYDNSYNYYYEFH